MFGKEDNTYDELRDNSINKWLEDMSKHEDITVRGGTKLAKEYLASLKKKIAVLEEKSATKDRYLKKMKMDKMDKE